MRNLIIYSSKWLYSHLWFSDIAFALLLIFIFNCILQRVTTKGPMSWPIFGILPTLLFHEKRIYEWGTNALLESGGTFRFKGVWMGGAHGIATIDPIKIEYMLKKNFKNFPKGRIYRERFYDLLGDGIFNADDALWRVQRKVANTEMHSPQFVQFSMHVVQAIVHEKLLKLLEAKKGCVIDFQEILLRFTFDNTCAVAFGVDPGCLAIDLPKIPFAKAFEEATVSSLMRFLSPPFIWKSSKFFGFGFEKTLMEAVKVVHEFAAKTVRERKMELLSKNEGKGSIGNSNSNQKCDLLSRLITMDHKENNMFFSDKLLQDFCISFILAGRDTSSVALTWFFWLMTQHPLVENQILDEIKQILTNRKNPKRKNQENIVFTEDELKKMVYLQAALSESLRLYPPVAFDHKETLEDDIFPDGTVALKGARIVYCMYGMGRMESIWGKDCLEFRPDRWIKDGEFVSESQFKYVVFNAGPRLCVGKKFAYMQMKMVAASVLLRYKVKLVEGHKVTPKINTTLYMKYGLLVTLEPRPKFM